MVAWYPPGVSYAAKWRFPFVAKWPQL
jgi:hypothetical protein